jgi:hypothetical protein
MKPKDFLEKFIDGYLFSDLFNLDKIKLRNGKKYGACGYPMLTTMLTGMELLGILLSKNIYNYEHGKGYFTTYWNAFLGNINPNYSQRSLANTVYQLARHGLVHTFITKTGIIVSKMKSTDHLEYDTSKSKLIIDVSILLKDFYNSYQIKYRPLILENRPFLKFTNIHAQKRINELSDQYSRESIEEIQKLPNKNYHVPDFYIMGNNSSTAVPTNMNFRGNSGASTSITASESFG